MLKGMPGIGNFDTAFDGARKYFGRTSRHFDHSVQHASERVIPGWRQGLNCSEYLFLAVHNSGPWASNIAGVVLLAAS